MTSPEDLMFFPRLKPCYPQKIPLKFLGSTPPRDRPAAPGWVLHGIAAVELACDRRCEAPAKPPTRALSHWIPGVGFPQSRAKLAYKKSHPIKHLAVWSQWNVEIPDKKPWFRLGVFFILGRRD